MAKRVIHELIDDMNGQPADESITFALDGVQYEIGAVEQLIKRKVGMSLDSCARLICR